jgi:histidinol-phosphate aminotransferase
MFEKRLLKIERLNNYNIDKSKFLRLDANERVIPFSKKDLNFLKKKVNNTNLQSYPTNRQSLVDIISKKEKIKNSQISITPGADTVLKYIFELISNLNGNVLSINPTYGLISIYCKIYNKKNYKINENELEKFNDIINYKNMSLIYIANPNSPSGNVIPKKIISSIVKFSKKKNILFIIDETYIEFSKSKSLTSLIKKHNNILVLKTYSKYFGLAGLRVGCIIANKNLIKATNALRPPHDVSNLGIDILKYFFLKKNYNYLKQIEISKNYIKKYCKKNDIKIYMTEANFFHIFEEENKILYIVNELKKNKILVKSIHLNFSNVFYSGPKDSIRVSIGSLKQMKFFFKNLKRIRLKL